MQHWRTNRLSLSACACAAAIVTPAALGQGIRIEVRQDGSIVPPSADDLYWRLDRDDPYIPASLRDAFNAHLRQLDSNQWDERRRAAEWLRTAGVTDSVFLGLLRASYLTPEQQHQVVSVLRDRILTAPRGAVGIYMHLAPDGLGVIVDDVLPRMPAMGRLREKDRITHINGMRITKRDQLGDWITLYRPGETVTLRIQRPVDNEPDDEEVGDAGPPPGRRTRFEVLDIQITLADDLSLGPDTVEKHEDRQMRRASEIVRETSPRVVELRVPEYSIHVEQHPKIDELRRQLEVYRLGGEDTRRALIAGWHATRQELLEQVLDPRIDMAERERRRGVYEAYAELIPRGLRS